MIFNYHLYYLYLILILRLLYLTINKNSLIIYNTTKEPYLYKYTNLRRFHMVFIDRNSLYDEV